MKQNESSHIYTDRSTMERKHPTDKDRTIKGHISQYESEFTSKEERAKIKLEKLYQFCKLLKIECIKKEIETYLEGYTPITKEKESIFEITLKNNQDDEINISFTFDLFSMNKYTKNSIERTVIYPNLIVSQRYLEKRPNGIVIRDIQKNYAPSQRFGNKIVLIDLYENRYAFTKESLEKYFSNIDFESDTPMRLHFRTRQFELHDNDLSSHCDHISKFSTHMNAYAPWTGGRKTKNNISSTYTYLNGEDVSRLYDLVDGEDKLYRVYDLYSGIINPRNEYDIHSIHLGLMPQESFDLISVKGISEKENSLVGSSTESNKKYYNYLKKLFYDKYGYNDKFKLDRESILKAITYQMSTPERAKRYVEKTLGIPYSEYEKLDWQDQYKLIEEKTGQKVIPNYLYHIDGIPMDEEHMFTEEKANKAIDKTTENILKKCLKKIFRKRS